MRYFDCGCSWHVGRRTALRAAVAGVAALGAQALKAPALAQPKTTVINTHAHFFPRAWLDLLRAEGGAYKTEWHEEANGDFVVSGPSGRAGPLPPGVRDIDVRLRDMDHAGVDIQAMSLTTPMTYWADPALSARLCATWNDACSAAHQGAPKRLYGLLTLPMLDEQRALAELERARALPGMRGVYMGTNINSIDLSDKRFLPIFRAIEAAGLPVFLHPVQTVASPRLAQFFFGNTIGNPLDTALAAGHLIFGGVLDACPALQVNLPHAGGVLPILTGRLDHGWQVRPELKFLKRAPSEYLKRFTYDTIAHSPDVMKFVIQQVGIERITLGDDYFFDMGEPEPVSFVEKLGLDPTEKAMALGGNAARLLKL